MEISERYNEEHEHFDKTCVTSHKRKINGKVYTFSRVGTPKSVIIGAYEHRLVIERSHSFLIKDASWQAR